MEKTLGQQEASTKPKQVQIRLDDKVIIDAVTKPQN